MKVAKYDRQNNVWDIPFLPPSASEINNLQSTKVLLSERNKADWKFFKYVVQDIPLPTDSNQDYNFNSLSKELWEDVIVPSSLTMQGFDIQNNQEYYYKRNITVDKTAILQNNRIFIQFEGIYCNSRIWINNKYVTTHIGGFTPFFVEITNYIDESLQCELIVGVSDIESRAVGIWNPNGELVSNASWGSYYAHNNIGGILRDVNLIYLPNQFILSNHIIPSLTDDYKDGKLDMELLLVVSGNIQLKIDLQETNGKSVYRNIIDIDDNYLLPSQLYAQSFKLNYDEFNYKSLSAKASDKKYSENFIPFKKCELKGSLYGIKLNEVIPNIKSWNAETPILYNLKLTLIKNEEEICNYSETIGFRRIDFNGINGTAKNKVYINGKEIKLRGVCRHDISYKYGRSLTPQEELTEVLSYKHNNVNHVRTSHYPASKNFVNLCDKYGIYVEMENAVCFKGGNGYNTNCPAQEILQSASEMIEYYYNNPSVIIWSIANESGFESSYGFRLSYDYMREKDCSRPLIFSYPHLVKSKPLPYDIFSKHYHNVFTNLGKKNMPKLHDEFAHVACYNLEDLTKDNNFRLAWGESIKIGWDRMCKDDGALGCAIWGGIDDVFYLPKGITIAHQRHTSSQAVGYGEWGALLDVFKREKPEAYLTKKAFSPIKIQNYNLTDNQLQLTLENRFYHTNLNAVICKIYNENEEVLHDAFLNCDILPSSIGQVNISLDNISAEKIDIAFYHDNVEVERETLLNRNSSHNLQSITKHSSLIKPLIKVNKDNLEFYHCDSKIATALKLTVNSKVLEPNNRFIQLKESKNGTVYIIKDNYGFLKDSQFIISPNKEGIVNIKMKNSHLMAASLGDKFGLIIDLKDGIQSVEWDKDTLYSYYPPNHLERKSGTALLNSPTNNEYGILPATDWKDDNYNYFLTNETEQERIYLSQDFKTARTNIKYYSVNYRNISLCVQAQQEHINCKANYEKNTKSIHCTDETIVTEGSWKFIRKNTPKCCIVSRQANSKISLSFTGIGIKIYGTRSKKQGEISIYVDGEFIRKISTRSDICDVLDFMVLDIVDNLEDKQHLLTVVLEDNKGVRISGFETIAKSEPETQSSIFIGKGQYYPSLAWGNYCGKKLTYKAKKELHFDLLFKIKR